MKKFREFLDKKQTDRHFKKAGEGQRLGTAQENAAGQQERAAVASTVQSSGPTQSTRQASNPGPLLFGHETVSHDLHRRVVMAACCEWSSHRPAHSYPLTSSEGSSSGSGTGTARTQAPQAEISDGHGIWRCSSLPRRDDRSAEASSVRARAPGT